MKRVHQVRYAFHFLLFTVNTFENRAEVLAKSVIAAKVDDLLEDVFCREQSLESNETVLGGRFGPVVVDIESKVGIDRLVGRSWNPVKLQLLSQRVLATELMQGDHLANSIEVSTLRDLKDRHACLQHLSLARHDEQFALDLID